MGRAYSYIENAYGVRFQEGERVTFTEGEPRYGTVMRESASHGHYVRVRFDDTGRPGFCHPRALEHLIACPSCGALTNAVWDTGCACLPRPPSILEDAS